MRSRRPITVNSPSTLPITLNPTQCLPTSSNFAPLSSSFATSTATVSRVASALLRDRNGRSVLGANQNSIVRENAKPSTGKHTSMSHPSSIPLYRTVLKRFEQSRVQTPSISSRDSQLQGQAARPIPGLAPHHGTRRSLRRFRQDTQS